MTQQHASFDEQALRRGLWQLAVLGALALPLAAAAPAGALPLGSPAWLLALPLLALATAYRHVLAAAGARLVATARRRRPTTRVPAFPGVRAAAAGSPPRASVRVPFRGARDASDRRPVPGRRLARQQRRSTRHEQSPVRHPVQRGPAPVA